MPRRSASDELMDGVLRKELRVLRKEQGSPSQRTRGTSQRTGESFAKNSESFAKNPESFAKKSESFAKNRGVLRKGLGVLRKELGSSSQRPRELFAKTPGVLREDPEESLAIRLTAQQRNPTAQIRSGRRSALALSRRSGRPGGRIPARGERACWDRRGRPRS